MNELVKIENNQIIVDRNAVERLKYLNEIEAELNILKKEINNGLKNAMEQKGIKKFIIDGLCATIRDSSTRTTIDSKRLKEECPDIFQEYSKTINVASSLVLTFEE